MLVTVKSFFGSRGVAAEDVAGDGRHSTHYKLLNDGVIREGVITAAADRYGYAEDRVRLRLYAGRFAGPAKGTHEARIRDMPGFEVFGPEEIASKLLAVAASKQYRDSPALAAVKLLVRCSARSPESSRGSRPLAYAHQPCSTPSRESSSGSASCSPASSLPTWPRPGGRSGQPALTGSSSFVR